MKRTLILLFFGMTIAGIAQEAYTLSPESTLTINGSSTIHDWTVVASTIEGVVKATSSNLNDISFKVAVADIKSERGAAMDKKMHEALKKEEYPKVTFVLKSPVNLEEEQQTLTGTLNIAGVEKEVEIATKLIQEDGKIHLSGNKDLKLSDFNMEPPTAMFGSIVVGQDITVNFDLVFSKS